MDCALTIAVSSKDWTALSLDIWEGVKDNTDSGYTEGDR